MYLMQPVQNAWETGTRNQRTAIIYLNVPEVENWEEWVERQEEEETAEGVRVDPEGPSQRGRRLFKSGVELEVRTSAGWGGRRVSLIHGWSDEIEIRGRLQFDATFLHLQEDDNLLLCREI